jgi:hypothetical protein
LFTSDSPLTELEELGEDEQRQNEVEKKNSVTERHAERQREQEEKYQQEEPSQLFSELVPFLSVDEKELWKPPPHPLPPRQDRSPSVRCMC